MICADNIPGAENDTALPDASLDGKNARLPRRVDQLNNVHDVQMFQISG
jgi:hypothetical protein